MSHTTAINSILITDHNALRQAVQHLKSSGINCELLENVIPRGYSANQQGMSDKAPFVLNLRDSKYDVGFYPTSQEGKNGLEARTDFWNNQVSKILGVTTKEKDVPEAQKSLGKFYQAYSAMATKNQAISQGYSVDESVQADGTVLMRLYA